MPAMFFVTGSLLAKSFGRRRPGRSCSTGSGGCSMPLWAFGLVAWADHGASPPGGRATASPSTGPSTWIFPLTDPMGSAWEGGWLSSHLWYLRTVVWLFLLAAPLLLRAVGPGPALTLAVPVVAVFALDLLTRGDGRPAGGPPALLGRGRRGPLLGVPHGRASSIATAPSGP